MLANINCVPPAAAVDAAPNPAQADLCGHSAEQFAEAALGLEPRGSAWCKLFTTTRAALHRAFGKLLSDFEQRLCALFAESLACESIELLAEWEREYGLPGKCAVGAYPTDTAGRQAQVCAARRASGIVTLAQLQELLRAALQCEYLTLTNVAQHSTVGGWSGGIGQSLQYAGGVCVSGITVDLNVPFIHNGVGGWGTLGQGLSGVYGPATGQPLTIDDPSYVPAPACPMVYHSTVGGWTGGIGQSLQYGDPVKYGLLVCLMQKHLPAHVAWDVC